MGNLETRSWNRTSRMKMTEIKFLRALELSLCSVWLNLTQFAVLAFSFVFLNVLIYWPSSRKEKLHRFSMHNENVIRRIPSECFRNKKAERNQIAASIGVSCLPKHVWNIKLEYNGMHSFHIKLWHYWQRLEGNTTQSPPTSLDNRWNSLKRNTKQFCNQIQAYTDTRVVQTREIQMEGNK